MKAAMRLKAQIKAMSLQVRIPANAVLQATNFTYYVMRFRTK